MGYSIYLVDKNKSITDDTLKDVIENLPKRLHGVFPSQQNWGWSLITDITSSEKNKIKYVCVSGSYGTSGKWALDMALNLQQKLQEKGFYIEIYSEDFGFTNPNVSDWLD